LPGDLSASGLEKPPGDFLEGDRLPATAALARRMPIDFGLLLQLLGEHCAGEGIADFGGLLFHVYELRPPRRTALGTVDCHPQFRRHILNPSP